MNTPPAITSFTGEHRFLSNFWPAAVTMDGMAFPSVEHAYQAAKTLARSERRWVQVQPTPGAAKKAGRRLRAIRPDWDSVKVDVMYDLVSQKFAQHPDLAARLRATAPALLVEGNTWGDRFWGVCNGLGDNWLGRILMTVRDGDGQNWMAR